MAKRNVSSYLPNLLGPIDFQLNGADESVVRRSVWNFIGTIAVADDPDNERTNITIAPGGGVSLPITDAALVGSARTLTLFEHTDLGGTADQLCVGGDAAFTSSKVVDYLTILAKIAIDWSCGASSTMSCTANGVTINNAKYFGCLPAADTSVLPTLGAIRLAQGLAIYSTNVANDRNVLLLVVDGSNYVTIGDTGGSFIQLLAGAGGADVIITAGAYSMRLAGGALTLSFPETVNAGTTTGETRTREDTLTTNDASDHDLLVAAIPTDSFVVWDVEVIAIVAGATVGAAFKRSRAFLNTAGTITDGVQKDIDDDAVGAPVGWTVTQDHSGTDARVVVNSGGDDVSWYMVSSRMRVVHP